MAMAHKRAHPRPTHRNKRWRERFKQENFKRKLKREVGREYDKCIVRDEKGFVDKAKTDVALIQAGLKDDPDRSKLIPLGSLGFPKKFLRDHGLAPEPPRSSLYQSLGTPSPLDPAYTAKLAELKQKPPEFSATNIGKLSEEAGKFWQELGRLGGGLTLDKPKG
jgi:hypothetical protein